MLRGALVAVLLVSSLACGNASAPAKTVVHQSVATNEPLETVDLPEVRPGRLAPAIEIAVPATKAAVAPMGYVAQTWNNCGPASVVMVPSMLGIDASQEVARLALRGRDISRGMPAQNVAPWVGEQYGLKALVRTNGSRDTIRSLVANGFPVIVTQWLYDAPSRIAHYRVVRGYDDASNTFLVNDPIRGAAVRLDYSWFDSSWQVFLYRYLVIYRPEDEMKVRMIVAEDWSDATMRANVYERVKNEAQAQPRVDAWIALGEAAYQVGRYEEAVAAFEHGLALGPASGVFTMRSSYPNALQALGRDGEADAVRAKLSGGR